MDSSTARKPTGPGGKQRTPAAASETADRLPTASSPAPLAERPGDPPVVARMVLELRSDGTRTVARAAVHESETGTLTQLEADAATPMALVWKLLRAMGSLPGLARAASKALVGK